MSFLLDSINPPRRRQNTVNTPTPDQPGTAHSEGIPQPKSQAADYDAPGTELDKDAPVWLVYVQETDMTDKEMCDDWNRSLDVTLIFAALFSAISTAFIIESMKKLQPDPTEQSAATLLNISRTLVAISNNQSVPLSSLPDPGSPQFTPPASSVLVNALWLSSLIISVGVSLIAMLAKKWCHVFLSARSGPYNEQARRRQKKWDGIVWWRMRGVMDVLPLLMHLALALFAIGLVVYLRDINTQVAVAILVIASTFGVLYGAATVLPSYADTCPYGTVLSEPLKPFLVPATKILARVIVPVLNPLLLGYRYLYDWLARAIHEWLENNFFVWVVLLLRHRALTLVYHNRANKMRPDSEGPAMDTVTSNILAWLVKNSENRDHVSVALQAISAASIELPMLPLRRIKAEEAMFDQLGRCISSDWLTDLAIRPTSSLTEVLSLFRALSHILTSDSDYHYHDDLWYGNSFPSFLVPPRRRIVTLYDLLARQGYLDSPCDPDRFILNASALMPAYHWAGGGNSSLLDETLAKMVSVIQKHSERTLILQTPALCAFVVGCSHYLVTHASKKDQRETVRQLILVLLRLNSATARSSDRLRYTIAVTLASSAAAGRLYRQMSMPAAAATGQLYHQMSQLLSTGETSTTRGARLFAEYIHQGAEPSDRYSTTAEQLLYFGVLGISHLLPFASVDSRLTSSLSGLAPRSLRDQPGFITLKTIPQHLTWDQLKIQAGLGCLKQVPKLNGSLDAEIALARYLQQVVRRINLTEPKAGLDQAALAAISAMCHARSTELWDCSLNALGLEIKDAEHLSDPHLDLVTRLRLAEHLFQVSIALNPCSSPPAMRRLWDLILLILRSTGLAPRDRLRALGSLPERCGLEGRQHLTTTHGLPHSIDDLQLEPVWYQTLESMISSGHAPEMDGKIIQVMIEHYRGEASAANNKGGILQKWLNLDASFKSEKKIRARKRWNVSLIVLRCIVRLRSRRQEDTLTSELDAVAL